VSAPAGKLRVAVAVLDQLARSRAPRSPVARKARAILFRAFSADPCKQRALACAATRLGLAPEAVLNQLFDDMPEERALAALPETVDPIGLALQCNQAIVAGLLYRALRVRVTARGNVRALVRHAKLVGLLCIAAAGHAKQQLILELSGPYALFRHTRIYGRALASLIPRLAWCHEFRLEADCVTGIGGEIGRLVLRSGDPIAPARELARFDSQVEERFARAFEKLASEWDLIREARAVPVGDGLIFPDFELRHRGTGECWLLEVAGYWTPEYVARKLAQLRAAQLAHLIVCLDEARACADGSLDAIGHVIRYRKWLDPRAVIAIIDPLLFEKLSADCARQASVRGSGSRAKPTAR